MGTPRPLRIRLLGGLDIDGLAPPEVGSRKARLLVKVLALGRGAAVDTGQVIDALWPDGDTPARPSQEVGVLASRLRRSLGGDRLVRTETGWLLSVDWLDVAELEARAAEAEERLDAGQYASARAAAQAAVDVIRGPLLPDDEGPWVEAARALAARLGGRMRLVLAEAAWAAGDAATATGDAERALDADPFDEIALCIAMRAHAATGRPATALALYAQFRERLADQLGVGPTAGTEAVHDEVLLADVASPSAPMLVRSTEEPSLVGRKAELRCLDAAAERIASGGAWTVDVVGDAGMGKTALLDAWAHGTALTVVRARGGELGRDLPLQPVLDALQADVHLPADDRPVATLLTDPTAGLGSLFATLLQRLHELAGPAGAAFILDDAQWVDPTTVAFCRMVRRTASRCLLVLARRSGTAVDVPADEHIRLGPLDLDAVTRLVGPARAHRLQERSGGNPLFLVHLAASSEDDLPDSVRGAVVAQVEDLGHDVAATLRDAAVLGDEIDLDLLATVLQRPAVELLGHLDAGASAGLLHDRGVLAFSHALVRDALVSDGRPSRVAWLHREAAGVLAARPRPDDLAVASHAQAGGDRVLASASLVRAAQVTAARFDADGAERLLDQAIALDDTPVAHLARARVRIARYRMDAAAEDAEAAVAGGGGAQAFEVAGWAAYYRRDHAGAARYADEGAATAADAAIRSSCLALGGRVRHSAGDLAGAAEVLSEALRIAPAGTRGLAQVWLSSVRSHQSRPDEAVELADRALLRPAGIGHPFAALHGHFARATALGHRGRVGEALTCVDRALVEVAEQGVQAARFQSMFLNVRGWILRNLGLLAEADAANRDALAQIAVLALTGEPYHVAHLDLLDGALARYDVDDISRWLAEASVIDHWDGTMSWRQKARLDLLRARIALRRDDATAALDLASSVVRRAEAWPVPRYRLLAQLVMDEVAARRGTADAPGINARLEALSEVAAPEAWWRTAELAVVLGDDDLAAEAERRAAVLVADAGAAGLDASAGVSMRLAAIRSGGS